MEASGARKASLSPLSGGHFNFEGQNDGDFSLHIRGQLFAGPLYSEHIYFPRLRQTISPAAGDMVCRSRGK